MIIIIFIFMFITPLSLVAEHYHDNDHSNFRLTHIWSKQVLNSLEPRAVLIIKQPGITGDAQIFSLAYMRLVNKLRPDLLIIDDSGIFGRPTGWQLEPAYFKLDFSAAQQYLAQYFWQYAELTNQPLYTTFPVNTALLTSRSNGVAYQVFAKTKAAPIFTEVYPLDLSTEKTENYDYSARDFLASYYYTAAARLIAVHNPDYSHLFLQAIEFDSEPFSAEYQSFIAYRQSILAEN